MVSQYSGLVDTLAPPSAPAPRQRADRGRDASTASFERHLVDRNTTRRSQADANPAPKAPVRNDKVKADAPTTSEAAPKTAGSQTAEPQTVEDKAPTSPQSEQTSAPKQAGKTQQDEPAVDTAPTPEVVKSEPPAEGTNADAGLIDIIIAASSTPEQTSTAPVVPAQTLNTQQSVEQGALPTTQTGNASIEAAADLPEVPPQSGSETAVLTDADTEVATEGKSASPVPPTSTVVAQGAPSLENSAAPAQTTSSPTANNNGTAPVLEAVVQRPSMENASGKAQDAATPNLQAAAPSAEPAISTVNEGILEVKEAPDTSKNAQVLSEQVPTATDTESAAQTSNPLPNQTEVIAAATTEATGETGQQAVQAVQVAENALPDQNEPVAQTESGVSANIETTEAPKAPTPHLSAILAEQTQPQALASEDAAPAPAEQASTQTAINTAAGTNTLVQPQPATSQATETVEQTDETETTVATSPLVQKSQAAASSTQPTNTTPAKADDAAASTPDEQPSGQKPAVSQSDANVNTLAESKPAPSRAPKGEAFSKMMAQVEGQTGLKDLAMQSDQTIKVDTTIPMQGDVASVRLTGMESFSRTGHIPQQAAAANAQALAAQISKFAGKGETRFEIRLDPADLGRVDVRLTIGSDGQTRAHMFVEKSETLDFLMRDQRTLERSLQQSGLTLDKQGMEFSLMDQGDKGQQMAQNSGEQLEQDAATNAEKSQDQDVPNPSILEPQHSGAYVATNGLNLVI